MKKKIFIAAAVIFNGTLQAQDSTRLMDEVVITANKFPNKTSLTGKVITVITRDQLEKSGDKDLSQVLTEQSGLFINGANSNPGKDKSVFLRGAKVDHTLITIDGVPVYDASGIGSNFDIRLIPIDDIERIEILKGSQSTLYGSDAIAGVINIITRKSGNKPFTLSGLATYGSYGTFHSNVSVSGNKRKFDYHLDYTYYRTDGINEATDTITRPHVVDKDGYSQNSIYAVLGYKPTGNIRIQPYLRYTRHNASIDQDAFIDDPDYKVHMTNIQAGVRAEVHLSRSILQLAYNYNDLKREYHNDSLISLNGYEIYNQSFYKAREHFAEAFLVYPLVKMFKLTVGLDLRSSNSDQDYYSVSAYGPYSSKLGKDSLNQHQLGVYAAIVCQDKSGLTAELGGRFTRHSAFGNNFVYNFNPSFLFRKQYKFFVNLSSAFKTPTLYQLYSGYGNSALKPELAFTAEGGVQYFSTDNRVNGRVTIFDRRVKDAISFYTDPITYKSWYINQDKQNDHGVELESTIRICRYATLKMFYSYTDGQITTKNAGKDTAYYNLYRRPKSNFGLTLEGHISQQVYLSTGLQWMGRRVDLTYDASFNQVLVTMKAYALWNLYAEYAVKKSGLKLFIGLHNITNSKYTEVYGFNTMGFNMSGGLRFDLH